MTPRRRDLAHAGGARDPVVIASAARPVRRRIEHTKSAPNLHEGSAVAMRATSRRWLVRGSLVVAELRKRCPTSEVARMDFSVDYDD
jgi:hypothetical protein